MTPRALVLAAVASPLLACGAGAEQAPVILVAAPPASSTPAPPDPPPPPEPRKSDVLRCPTARDGNRTYAFCPFGLSWHRAEAYCRELKGHLVTIHDRAEDIFVFLEANKHSHERWWIGLNDIHREGSFEWASGSPVHYTHWEPGEPNDAGGNEDCAQINRYHPSEGWNDEPCDQLLRFICEIR